MYSTQYCHVRFRSDNFWIKTTFFSAHTFAGEWLTTLIKYLECLLFMDESYTQMKATKVKTIKINVSK